MQAVNWLLISYFNLSFLDLKIFESLEARFKIASVGKKYISRK